MPFPTGVVQSILCEPKVSFAFQLISNVSNGARLYSTRYTQTRLTFQSRKRRRTEEKDTTRWSQLRLQSSRSPFVPFLSVCSGGLWASLKRLPLVVSKSSAPRNFRALASCPFHHRMNATTGRHSQHTHTHTHAHHHQHITSHCHKTSCWRFFRLVYPLYRVFL